MQKVQLERVVIRPAMLSDCVAMKNLINAHAAHGLMRPKGIGQLTTNLLRYVVAELDQKVIGVCGSKIWPTDGVEIISSAVLSKFHGMGIGERLNRRIIEMVVARGFKKIFILTKQPGFYAKLGFEEIPKIGLSNKIYEDCHNCPENTSEDPRKIKCSDTAMELRV